MVMVPTPLPAFTVTAPWSEARPLDSAIRWVEPSFLPLTVTVQPVLSVVPAGSAQLAGETWATSGSETLKRTVRLPEPLVSSSSSGTSTELPLCTSMLSGTMFSRALGAVLTPSPPPQAARPRAASASSRACARLDGPGRWEGVCAEKGMAGAPSMILWSYGLL